MPNNIETAICEKCGASFPARRAFVIIPAGKWLATGVRLFCSGRCREAAKNAPLDQAQSKTSMSSKPGARKPKKPARTPGEIKRALQPSESQVSKTIRDDMKRTAAFSTRLQSGRLRIENYWVYLCAPGTPDSFFADGLICFVEFKKADKQPTDEQKAAQKALRENGAVVFTLDNYDDYSFIRSELKKRRQQIADINQRIAALQSAIESELKNKKGK